jgi:acyl dehydratase
MATTIDGVDGLKAAVGDHLGYSDWHEITQDRINAFAEATGDHQWIHVDPERAKEGPFGRTIGHGYLTLSLAPWLMSEVLQVTGMAMGLNYGGGGGVQATIDLTFELEGETKPACVAQAVYRYYA